MSVLHPPFEHDLPVTRAAIAYARECHAAQLREVDAAPFILHPLEVAMLLHGRGYDDEVVAAGALHDVLEKTGMPLVDQLRFELWALRQLPPGGCGRGQQPPFGTDG